MGSQGAQFEILALTNPAIGGDTDLKGYIISKFPQRTLLAKARGESAIRE